MIITGANAQDNCCPQFSLQTNVFDCDPRGDVKGKADGADMEKIIVGCKNSLQDYFILPNMPGFNFSWEVEGGELISDTGNPVQIKWSDYPQNNRITIYIESEDGLCKDTLEYFVILKDSPTAGFEFSPESPVCLNQLVNFNNTST